MSSADVETSLEDKDVDDKGRKFETTTEATWDIEVKPVELLISLPSDDDDDAAAAVAEDDNNVGDIENVAVKGGSGDCNLSSKEGNNIVLL